MSDDYFLPIEPKVARYLEACGFVHQADDGHRMRFDDGKHIIDAHKTSAYGHGLHVFLPNNQTLVVKLVSIWTNGKRRPHNLDFA